VDEARAWLKWFQQETNGFCWFCGTPTSRKTRQALLKIMFLGSKKKTKIRKPHSFSILQVLKWRRKKRLSFFLPNPFPFKSNGKGKETRQICHLHKEKAAHQMLIKMQKTPSHSPIATRNQTWLADPDIFDDFPSNLHGHTGIEPLWSHLPPRCSSFSGTPGDGDLWERTKAGEVVVSQSFRT